MIIPNFQASLGYRVPFPAGIKDAVAALLGQGIPRHERRDCVEPRSIAEAIDDAAYI